LCVANCPPPTVISTGAESEGQSSEFRKVSNPVEFDADRVSVSGGRLKLNALKIALWSSCGRSCE
jgi:hypothetical protein